MKFKIIFLLFLSSLFLFGACRSVKQSNNVDNWHNVAVIDDVEVFVDTASIRHEGAVAFAREKRVFVSPQSRAAYVEKIRTEYAKMGKAEKADKWNDFSYCIYTSLYECTNKRFRVLSVEDYDSAGKRIARTTPPKGQLNWLQVENETVGDYTFFYVCDYGN